MEDKEIEIERQLAYAETILSPKYLESKIEEYELEIRRCRDMIRFYKKGLKDVTNPKSKAYKISKKYKLQ